MKRLRANHLAPLAALVAAGLLALLAAGCGGGGSESGGSESGSESGTASENVSYRGAEATPPKAAPELKLKNYLGEPVNLADLKGKAVFVTFIYDHCPDTCPLIVSHLRTALAELSPEAAKNLEIVAVSTDPKGDTPKTVANFLDEHGMTGKMKYLIGSRPELEKVWGHWNIVAKPEKAHPEAVEHSALIYGIAANGKVTTLYSADFKPAEVSHDVPLLERQ